MSKVPVLDLDLDALMGKELNDVVCAAYKMGCDQTREVYQKRIEKLEAALREMLIKCTWENTGRWCGSIDCHCRIARKALEGKGD
jgi:hypothetical protein